ncbi:MAG TPA: bifunctional glycosyltransferase/class I SAM-dependent methyltransferase [Solirubrobacteraceae bacterium]|jgi:2-polyprenyl-3-methyl-5-hydroxy-6-metoxy-1,4-benzoquinol methylase|nr:bifunctional glycosyltransferase/class I SAM-dependent methyltransferase [Solirubrobacteraceae bacterium]
MNTTEIQEGAETTTGAAEQLRIGILVVAYNAESTLASVLDRVPKSFRPRISEVLVCDDASADSTYLVGLGYKQTVDDLPLKVIRHPENLGYGGNQKAGYRMAIEMGLDVIVMLHGDGQYAPESLPEIVAPLERGEADAVMGSRMMDPGGARRGGMPLYKYVGNRILTKFENKVLGTDLTEFHSGYRAYRVDALKAIPFEGNSDGFNFDTQIIIQLVDAGRRIVEVPIPTYYGDEICYVDGLKYAKDVSGDVVRYRLGKMGFDSGDFGGVGDEYGLKQNDSSHATILRWLEHRPPANLLDLGCSGGLLSERIRALGHTVTGVDVLEIDGVRDRVDHFIQADLDRGLPAEVADRGPYDVVVCGDILEHVRSPEQLLREVRALLGHGGVLIASVPNFGHWYARTRTVLGLFDYDQRGVLDNGHVRFFTRRGLLRRLRNAGFKVVRLEATGLPLDVLAGGSGPARRILRIIDRLLVSVRPTVFGYQFICMCEPSSLYREPNT